MQKNCWGIRRNSICLYLTKKSEKLSTFEKKADLGANFVTIGNQKPRLRIFNKGITAAHQITIDFTERNDIIHERDIQEKFPLELLERRRSVDLIATVAMSAKKVSGSTILAKRHDGEMFDKTVYPTL